MCQTRLKFVFKCLPPPPPPTHTHTHTLSLFLLFFSSFFFFFFSFFFFFFFFSLSLSLSVCLFVCLSVCLSLFFFFLTPSEHPRSLKIILHCFVLSACWGVLYDANGVTYFVSRAVRVKLDPDQTYLSLANSRHWFTTSFLQPLL